MSSFASETHINLKVLHTSDVHGNFFPYNFITRSPWSGSMARVATYVDSVRRSVGEERVVLLDGGDILQGQPSAYYYNFIDTASVNLASRIYDYLGYDAATIGNHDVETGHDVYDRWINGTHVPVLGANMIDTETQSPYIMPYLIMEREGVKIAILGLITPAIPAWLPETLWSGLRFDDMMDAARQWLPIIRRDENPDVVIGLFHAGRDASKRTAGYLENASYLIAEEIPGFDLVLFGHDHQRFSRKITNIHGDSVTVLNPGNNANFISEADINITLRGGKIIDKSINGHLVNIEDLTPDRNYMNWFEDSFNDIDSFVSRKIGVSDTTFTTHDAFFGPSAFMSLLHRLQLDISGAEISFAAPLAFDAEIHKGDIRVSDMFTLYKYENLLYVMAMTGREIKDYLEEAYSLWTNQMLNPSDHVLAFASDEPSPTDNFLKNPTYNFDSAAGIDYTVDVTKPRGEKITILSMSDGTPFDMDRSYTVAVNSYRGNGGGDLMTKGAGIPHSQLKDRIISSTDKDLRYYILQLVEKEGTLSPHVMDNWRFVPEEIAIPALMRDREILLPEKPGKQSR